MTARDLFRDPSGALRPPWRLVIFAGATLLAMVVINGAVVPLVSWGFARAGVRVVLYPWALLASAEIEIETKVVYRAVPVTQLAHETLTKMQAGEIDAVLHYSRRSAEIFLILARKGSNGGAAGGVLHLCLSEAVAAPLVEAGFEVKVAAHPNEDALFALLD